MYKLLLLDADGTIFDFDKAEEYALQSSLEYFKYHGDFIELKKKYKIINSGLWHELELGNISKNELREERFRRLFTIYKLDFNIKDFSDIYLQFLSKGSYLIDGAVDICKYLSSKYKLVILTNGIKEVQLSRLEGSVIKDYISDIIISEEAGVNKPDPYIFEYSFNRIKHNCKSDVMIIGDSLTSDIQGGNNFGIDSCWLNLNNITNKTTALPTYSINSLAELKELL